MLHQLLIAFALASNHYDECRKHFELDKSSCTNNYGPSGSAHGNCVDKAVSVFDDCIREADKNYDHQEYDNGEEYYDEDYENEDYDNDDEYYDDEYYNHDDHNSMAKRKVKHAKRNRARVHI